MTGHRLKMVTLTLGATITVPACWADFWGARTERCQDRNLEGAVDYACSPERMACYPVTLPPVGGFAYRYAAWAWNRLRTSLREAYGPFAYFRTVEVQARGAPHYHLIIATDVFWPVKQWQRLLMAAGFGQSSQLAAVRSPIGAAMYVAKFANAVDYVTKDATSAEGIPAGFRFYAASSTWAKRPTLELEVTLPVDGARWSYVRMNDARAAIDELASWEASLSVLSFAS